MTSHPVPEASVVVVTWNGRDLLEQSLPAIVGQRDVHHEVIVVDNGSGDGTAEWIARAHPSVRLHRLPSNLGFAAANNLAFELARAPLIATINNDAVPDPDWLACLLSAAREHPEAGMWASRMVFAHDPETINAAGISTDALGIAWDRYSGRRVGGDREGEVFGASAGAALYRRELLDATGGFDSDFFAYLEDVDLAWRARWLGWMAWYVPEARVVHAHSATGIEESPTKTYYLGRNKFLTIFKNYPAGALLRYLPLLLAYDLASVPITIVRQRNLAALRGRLAALAALPRLRRARRRVMAGRRVEWRDIKSHLDPVAPPWTVWRRYRRLRRTLALRPSPD